MFMFQLVLVFLSFWAGVLDRSVETSIISSCRVVRRLTRHPHRVAPVPPCSQPDRPEPLYQSGPKGDTQLAFS